MFPDLPRAARLQAFLVAALALGSVVAQWVYLMGARGTGPLETLIDMTRFFTILTMVLLVAVFTHAGLSRTHGHTAPLIGAVTLAAVMTGAVYHLLLAEYWNPTGLGMVADWGLHTIVPIAVFLWWLAYAPKTPLVWADLPAFLLWPAVYTAYALGLGTRDGIYPYPFMDPTLAGPWQVAATLAMLGIAVLLGGVLMIGLGRFADR
ncbi:MAG: Pr6Pr family membrane protein [Roseicyclus sp.]